MEENSKMERAKQAYTKVEPDAGPGIPKYFLPLLHPEMVAGMEARPRRLTPQQAASEFTNFTAKLNLDEYQFDDEIPKNPGKSELELDVTALDRYNDDVRTYRRILVEECRSIPLKPTLDMKSLEELNNAVAKLCRSAYYGTYKAQSLAEGTVPLLVWVLSRKYFPDEFRVSVLKSMSEMFWSSLPLKQKLVTSMGIKVLFQTMQSLPTKRRMATWACYTLTMAATGCAEVIKAAVSILGMEELVGEMSFEMYWYDWPVNFGMVLQGVLYGPHSVTANEELFQFL